MLVERSMDPGWLSNAYLVAEREGGDAVFVDSGAPLEPLLRAAERWRVEPRFVLRTHGHHDHVANESQLGLPVRSESLSLGELEIEALPTPGHSDDGVAFVIGGEACFTGDTLFRGSVGGGDYEGVKRSVMEVLMVLPHETRVYPGHTADSTIGREWDENPFVRVWRGADEPLREPCRVGGRDAQLMVWSPDYDGKGKAWVRLSDGRDEIVGGSRVER